MISDVLACSTYEKVEEGVRQAEEIYRQEIAFALKIAEESDAIIIAAITKINKTPNKLSSEAHNLFDVSLEVLEVLKGSYRQGAYYKEPKNNNHW